MADKQAAPRAETAPVSTTTPSFLEITAPVDAGLTFPMFRAATPLVRAIWRAEVGTATALCE